MSKPKITEQFIVTVTSEGPIKDLADHVANRLWSLDRVTFVDVKKSEHPVVTSTTDVHLGGLDLSGIRAAIDKQFGPLTSDLAPHFSGWVETVGKHPEPLSFSEMRLNQHPLIDADRSEVTLVEPDGDRPMLINANALTDADL